MKPEDYMKGVTAYQIVLFILVATVISVLLVTYFPEYFI